MDDYSDQYKGLFLESLEVIRRWKELVVDLKEMLREARMDCGGKRSESDKAAHPGPEKDTNKRVTTEDILGEFGFRVRWSVSNTWADVAVFDITGRDANSNVALFNRRDWVALPDPVESIEEAESYLEGFVKWDGCTELNQGQPHWCGPEDYKKHIALLRYIYRRAFELMGHKPETPWGEEVTE